MMTGKFYFRMSVGVRMIVKKAQSFLIGLFYILVARGGIEPPTQGFSVLCSTN